MAIERRTLIDSILGKLRQTFGGYADLQKQSLRKSPQSKAFKKFLNTPVNFSPKAQRNIGRADYLSTQFTKGTPFATSIAKKAGYQPNMTGYQPTDFATKALGFGAEMAPTFAMTAGVGTALKGTRAIKMAQKPLTKAAAKVGSPLLTNPTRASSLLSKGLANIAQGLPYTAAYQIPSNLQRAAGEGRGSAAGDIAGDIGFDLATGAIPIVGAALGAVPSSSVKSVGKSLIGDEISRLKGTIFGVVNVGSKRFSQNPKWYRDLYKSNNRAPNKAEWTDLAEKSLKGQLDGFWNQFGDSQIKQNIEALEIEKTLDDVSTKVPAIKTKFDVNKIKLDTGHYRVSDTGAISASYDPQSTSAIAKVVSQEKLDDRLLKKSLDLNTPKADIPNISKIINKETTAGQWDIGDMKDISNIAKGFGDMYRNFEKVFGDQFPKVKKTILVPFDKAKRNFVDMQSKYLNDAHKVVVKGLGIKKGSKKSKWVQLFGEGQASLDDVKSEFPNDWKNIVDADKYFRSKYDELLEMVNGSIAKIYPDQPDRIIPRRQDYYRHFRELEEGIAGIKNVFDSPANIPSNLTGISEYTKPKQRFLPIAQERLGIGTDIDAVGGYLNYLRQASYATHIDPEISKFRNLSKDLEALTGTDALDPVGVGKLNNFLEFLNDYANGLAGKTNPLDRSIQKFIPGGRKAFKAANWLNRRVKANVILGNVSASLAQPFNIPQAAADMGFTHFSKGTGKSLASILDSSGAIKDSDFITERYFKDYAKFDTGMTGSVKKMAVWITSVLDEVSTKAIWNGYYDKAITSNIPDPMKYADDLTRKMVAGRSVGEVPIAQESSLFQIVAPFQVEVANLWNVFGDWTGEGGTKAVEKLIKYSVASYLMNSAVKQVRGSDVSFNPIQATLDAHESFTEEESTEMGLLLAGGRMAGEFLSNIPLGQTAAVMYPEYGFKMGETEMPTREQLFGEGDPTRFGSGLLAVKGLTDPLFKVLPPFGGQQVERSIEGAKTYAQGYSETDSGRVRFPVEQSPMNLVKNVAFGQYSTGEAREYFDADRRPLSEKQSELFKQATDKVTTYMAIHDDREKGRVLREAKESLEKSSDKVFAEGGGAGGAKVVGEDILVLDKNGDVQTINIIAPPSEDDKVEYAKWEDDAYKNGKKVLNAQGLPESDKQMFIEMLGLDRDEVEYYDMASEAYRIRSIYAREEATNLLGTTNDRTEMLQALIDMRRRVAGKMILTSSVINDLVDEGIISKDEGKQLKKVEWGEDGAGVPTAGVTGRGKSAKLKKINIKFDPLNIKIPATNIPSASKFKLAEPDFMMPEDLGAPDIKVPTVEQPKFNIKFDL